jgi:putative membrane protein
MSTKTIATLTALALATASLAACNNQNDAMTDDGTTAGATTDATTDPTLANGNTAGMDGMDGMNQPGMSDAMTGPDGAAGGAGGEALALVMAVDQHEISAAEQARGKDLPDDVAEYANMLHTEHTRNLEADRQLAQDSGISPATTERVTAQQEKGQAVLDQLAELEGEAYAEAYVNAMVQGHTEALTLIDEQLLPAATDPALQAHLTSTREAIAKHLEQGKALQGE